MAIVGYAGVPEEVKRIKEREEIISSGEVLAPERSFSQLFENHDNRLREDWKERQEFLKNFSKVRDIKIYVDTKTINNRAAVATYIIMLMLWVILAMATYIIYKRWLI